MRALQTFLHCFQCVEKVLHTSPSHARMYPFDSIFLASEPHRPLFEFIFLVSEGFYYQPDVTSWASLRTIKGRCGTGRGRSSSVGGSKRSVPAIRTCLIQSGAGASTGLGPPARPLLYNSRGPAPPSFCKILEECTDGGAARDTTGFFALTPFNII